MQLVLNSIAVEPNRWTPGKIPHYRLAGLLGAIAKAGFRSLEVWQNHVATLDPEGVQELKSAGERLGITFAAVGMYPLFYQEGPARKEQLEWVDRVCRYAETLQAGIVKFPAGHIASAELTPEQRADAVAFTREMLDLPSASGFTFTVETHGSTVADTAESTLRFIGEVGCDRFRVCWQPFDFSDTDKAIELYDELSPHVAHLHLQGRAKNEMELLEKSEIDYRRVLAHILSSGFDGLASIEFVRDCVVESPDQFHLDTVLANAARDREFVESFAR